MANLGTIGKTISYGRCLTGHPGGMAVISSGGTNNYYTGLHRDNTIGSLTAPSLKMIGAGKFSFEWPVDAVLETLTIDCKLSATSVPAAVVVKTNSLIGIFQDTIVRPTAITTWQTIGPISVTPLIAGILTVELWRYPDTTAETVNWDRIISRLSSCPFAVWDGERPIIILRGVDTGPGSGGGIIGCSVGYVG